MFGKHNSKLLVGFLDFGLVHIIIVLRLFGGDVWGNARRMFDDMLDMCSRSFGDLLGGF